MSTQHPAVDRVKSVIRNRSCVKRITDAKRFWVGVVILWTILMFGLAAVVSLATKHEACGVSKSEGTNASIAFVVLGFISGLGALVFGCCVQSTEDELADEMGQAIMSAPAVRGRV